MGPAPATPVSASSDGRFMALDGMRGVAALVVLVLHLPPIAGLVPHGYVAVDLFYIMSGFVVAHAYEGRLQAGWSRRAFLRARVVRLWPMYLLGMAIGAGVFAGAIDDAVGFAALGLLMGAAVMMIPTPLDAGSQLFILNPPAWSLFFEMAANLVYAAVARNLSTRTLKIVVACGAVAVLVAFLLAGKGSVGQHGGTLLGGVARIGFGFPLGLLLHRLWVEGRLTMRWPPILIVAAFVAVAMAPDLGRWNGALDAAIVLGVLPLIAVAAISARLSPRLEKAAGFAAALSYPLYIMHGPIIRGFETWIAPTPPVFLLGGAVSLVAAWAAARWFDRPARALLGRLLQQRRPAALTA
jgi:peptidoglycan/LPS O-acetylase OafA/YrhL